MLRIKLSHAQSEVDPARRRPSIVNSTLTAVVVGLALNVVAIPVCVWAARIMPTTLVNARDSDVGYIWTGKSNAVSHSVRVSMLSRRGYLPAKLTTRLQYESLIFPYSNKNALAEGVPSWATGSQQLIRKKQRPIYDATTDRWNFFGDAVFGWPVQWCGFSWHENGRSQIIATNGYVLSDKLLSSGQIEAGVFPTRVHWFGFIQGWAVWSAIAFLGRTALAKIRKSIRLWKGLCVTCGYDIKDLRRCPECGNPTGREA